MFMIRCYMVSSLTVVDIMIICWPNIEGVIHTKYTAIWIIRSNRTLKMCLLGEVFFCWLFLFFNSFRMCSNIASFIVVGLQAYCSISNWANGYFAITLCQKDHLIGSLTRFFPTLPWWTHGKIPHWIWYELLVEICSFFIG